MAGENGGTFEVKAQNDQVQEPRSGFFFMAQVTLRIIAIISTAVAIPVMVKSNREILVYGLNFYVRYSYFSSFKLVVAVDAVVCAFSAGSLIYVITGLNRPVRSNPMNHFYLHLHDMVMTILMMAACAAATAEGYIGSYGVDEIGWLKTCNQASKFCKQILVSVALSYVAFFAYLALSVFSAYKLVSRGH